MQLNHYNSKFQKKSFPLKIVCDNMTSPYNIGGLFRVSEAFGVEEIIFGGSENLEFGRRMKRSARATDKLVAYSVSQDLENTLVVLKQQQHQIMGLEITNESKSLNTCQLNLSKPLVLILGNENLGISEPILNLCDVTLHINMFGSNSSMNVIQAASIALYEITNQLQNL